MKNSILKIKELFKNKDLFDQALTHRSWINENKGKSVRESNERLEFLGDAVLEFVVSDILYKKFKDKNEGYLTALRANLVNTQNLSEIAKKLKVGELIFLSKGEDESGGRNNQSLLADTVEAIIGAIYLDLGLNQVSDFIKDNLFADIEVKIRQPLKDPKSLLQEKIQAMGLPAPKYRVISESGPDHNKRFVVEVISVKETLARGEGKSKSLADQEAAKAGLLKLEKRSK
jgi:ribonuclease-3